MLANRQWLWIIVRYSYCYYYYTFFSLSQVFLLSFGLISFKFGQWINECVCATRAHIKRIKTKFSNINFFSLSWFRFFVYHSNKLIVLIIQYVLFCGNGFLFSLWSECVWIGNENYIIIVQVCVYLCMLFMMATQLYAIYSNYYYCHNRKIAIHTLFGFILFHNVCVCVFVRLLAHSVAVASSEASARVIIFEDV